MCIFWKLKLEIIEDYCRMNNESVSNYFVENFMKYIKETDWKQIIKDKDIYYNALKTPEIQESKKTYDNLIKLRYNNDKYNDNYDEYRTEIKSLTNKEFFELLSNNKLYQLESSNTFYPFIEGKHIIASNMFVVYKGKGNSGGNVFWAYEGDTYTHRIQSKIRINDNGTIEYKISGVKDNWTPLKKGISLNPLKWFSRSIKGGKRRKTAHKRTKKGRTTRRR